MAAVATKLESVNKMLAVTGYMRATTLTSPTRAELITAEQVLDEVDREVQQEGWHFNTTYNESKDEAGGTIPLGSDIFSISQSSGSDKPGNIAPKTEDYSIRSGLVFNHSTGLTTGFTAAVTLNIVYKIDFADLPQYAVAFITAKAARQFYMNSRGKDSQLAQEGEVRARAAFMQEEARLTRFNAFRNPDMSWVEYYR
jgi:hypothetical protein